MINLELLKQELIRDEGIRYSAYQDIYGYWTIGVGRLIDSRKQGKLSPDEVLYLLTNDLEHCIADIQGEVWYQVCNDTQKRGLLDMRFQLGSEGIQTFKTSLGLIAARKFAEAGINLRKSLWYRQTPERAERVIKRIEGTSNG